MVDRIASFVHTRQMTDSNLRLQSRYAEGQIQVASGQKSETYQGISKETNRILNLESEYKQLSTQAENNQIVLDRTETMFDTLGSIITATQSFSSDLTSAISGISVTPAQIQEIAITVMGQVQSSMNVQLGGRYLFSGSATDVPPVDTTAAGFGGAVIPSTPNTAYYQGNDFIQSVEASQGFTLQYGVTADNPALEQIFRALDLVITTPGDPNTLQEALSVLQSGMDDLSLLRAGVAQDSQTLDQKIDEALEEMNLIDNIVVNLKEVDVAEVSIKLKEIEAQLEASYSVTTTLLRLNLTDFIR